MDKNLDIQIDGARDRIKVYYETKSGHDEADEEGDKASVNIAKILGEKNKLRNRDILVGSTLSLTVAHSAIGNNPKSNIYTLNCTLEETAVLRCIEPNSEITQKEMASTIRKSERPVKTLTSTLVEKGILVRKNGRPNGWWEIINN